MERINERETSKVVVRGHWRGCCDVRDCAINVLYVTNVKNKFQSARHSCRVYNLLLSLSRANERVHAEP